MGVAGLSRPAVFLDRDGTLNRAFVVDGVSHPPTRVEDLELLPGVAEALERLKAAGFRLVVVTNQPDVARGTLARATADAINAELRARLPALDDLLCCLHDDVDGCDCRKPKAGLLRRAASLGNVDLERSFLVGDSWRDTGAARNAGCTSIQLRGPVQPVAQPVPPEYWATDLAEASALILRLAAACSSR